MASYILIQVTPMMHMEPTMIADCDGVRNKSGCYEIVSRLIFTVIRIKTRSACFVITFAATRLYLKSISGLQERLFQIVTDMMRDFWPSADKRMPKDEPVCGFRGERCDFTLLIVGIALVIAVILVLLGIFVLRRIA